jgi:hypothetical protein
LCFVTSIGCGASRGALNDEVYSVLKPVLIEGEAEARLKVSFYLDIVSYR